MVSGEMEKHTGTNSAELHALDIRTKTVEATLTPLFQQISYLVNQKSERRKSISDSEITSASSTVRNAVERFTQAAEKVAVEHPVVKDPLLDACEQATVACGNLLDKSNSLDQACLVSPSRQLLSAMYKVLTLADSIIVNEICTVKEKVEMKLDSLAGITHFTEFLNNFTSFGNDMIEFGKLTGERQLDMKRELDAAKMACLRGFLEKSAAIYLNACKICLRHPASDLGKDIRATVVNLMRSGLNEIKDIVCRSPSTQTEDHEKILEHAVKQFNDSLEMCIILSSDITSVQKVEESFSLVDEYVHEFTDSAYTSHQHRELIILMCDKCKQEVEKLCANQSMEDSFMLEVTVNEIQASLRNLKKCLVQHVINSSSELLSGNVDAGLLVALRSAAENNEEDMVQNIASQIRDHVEQLQELSKQMQHVAHNDTFYIRVKYTSCYLLTLTELLIQSAEVYCFHGMSHVAVEGYTAMSDSWVMLIGELAAASEELQDSLYQS